MSIQPVEVGSAPCLCPVVLYPSLREECWSFQTAKRLSLSSSTPNGIHEPTKRSLSRRLPLVIDASALPHVCPPRGERQCAHAERCRAKLCVMSGLPGMISCSESDRGNGDEECFQRGTTQFTLDSPRELRRALRSSSTSRVDFCTLSTFVGSTKRSSPQKDLGAI